MSQNQSFSNTNEERVFHSRCDEQAFESVVDAFLLKTSEAEYAALSTAGRQMHDEHNSHCDRMERKYGFWGRHSDAARHAQGRGNKKAATGRLMRPAVRTARRTRSAHRPAARCTASSSGSDSDGPAPHRRAYGLDRLSVRAASFFGGVQ